jgi:DNA-directed RNA polymerase subunit K/omega
MPKKPSKKEESDDELEEFEDDVEIEEVEDFDDTEFNDDNDEIIIDPDLDPEIDGTKCIIDETINEDNEYFDNNDEIELPNNQLSEYVKKEDRISSDRLTNYEMVRILGERTKQLTMGAKPLIKNYQNLSYDRVAEEELKKNMIPFKIKRPLPRGQYEIWTLDELKKDHLLTKIES